MTSARAFLLLRYTLIASTAYLLLVEHNFALPPLGVLGVLVLALISNVVCAELPERLTSRPLFNAAVIAGDTLWITAVLVATGGFGADFFYLYFFVLLLAAIGANLRVIALTAVCVCVAYVYVLTLNGTILSWWHSPSIIRLPFLFITAAFYGFLTERARHEQRRAREQAFADLERLVAQRTADLTAANHELTAFAHAVSHDLRAPLRAVDAFAQALAEDYGDRLDARGLDYLRRVRLNARRMGLLIEDLLQLARFSRAVLHVEEVDLSALARRIADDLSHSAPGRAVTWEIEPDMHVHGDPALLRTLLEQLLRNAWQYTSRRAHAHIAVGTIDHGGERAIFVRDDGCGFPPEMADSLFQSFRRVHAGGTDSSSGAGLATARRIVRRHGGHIWATGRLGHGATFTFTLGTTGERAAVADAA